MRRLLVNDTAKSLHDTAINHPNTAKTPHYTAKNNTDTAIFLLHTAKNSTHTAKSEPHTAKHLNQKQEHLLRQVLLFLSYSKLSQ
ncbi:hypothetical protein FHR85_001228 [Alkalibacillus almallahensis]|nr:hypothetical protein [Alkalibacillus almallahensis]